MLWCGAWWPTSGSRPLPLPINCATLALPCVLLFALLLFFVCVYVPFVFGNAIKALVGPRAWMGRRLVGQLLAVVSMWPGTRAPKQPQCVQLLRRTSQEYNQPTNKHKMEKKNKWRRSSTHTLYSYMWPFQHNHTGCVCCVFFSLACVQLLHLISHSFRQQDEPNVACMCVCNTEYVAIIWFGCGKNIMKKKKMNCRTKCTPNYNFHLSLFVLRIMLCV